MFSPKTIILSTVLIVTAQALEPHSGYDSLNGQDKIARKIHASVSLEARDASQNYRPNQAQCTGAGTTCQEACGGESTECASTNANQLYCYDPSAGATCCPDGRGHSCAAGYYCYPGELSQTLCCSNGTTESECLQKFVATQSTTTGPASPTATGSMVVDGDNKTQLNLNGTNSTFTATNSTAKANSTAVPSSTSACTTIAANMLPLLGIAAVAFFFL